MSIEQTGEHTPVFDIDPRYTKTDGALAYLERTTFLVDQQYPGAEQELFKAQYAVQEAVSEQILRIKSIDDSKYVHSIIEWCLDYDESLHPTYLSVVPKTVKLITDDELASRYLSRMLSGDGLLDRWYPIVDWAALKQEGGLDSVQPASDINGRPHNNDILVMKDWAQRFKAQPVGGELDEMLFMIGEQAQYPTLFNLPK